MSEDYRILNTALAELLKRWRFPHLANYVSGLRASVYDLWEVNKTGYFSTLHVRARSGEEDKRKERGLSEDDAKALNMAFKKGSKKSLQEIRALLYLGRPDLEGRVTAHPRDARERPSSEGRMTHRYYGPRTSREA